MYSLDNENPHGLGWEIDQRGRIWRRSPPAQALALERLRIVACDPHISKNIASVLNFNERSSAILFPVTLGCASNTHPRVSLAVYVQASCTSRLQLSESIYTNAQTFGTTA